MNENTTKEFLMDAEHIPKDTLYGRGSPARVQPIHTNNRSQHTTHDKTLRIRVLYTIAFLSLRIYLRFTACTRSFCI